MQQKGRFGIQGASVVVFRLLSTEYSHHLPLHESPLPFITTVTVSLVNRDFPFIVSFIRFHIRASPLRITPRCK